MRYVGNTLCGLTISKPVIAALHGVTIGGAVEMLTNLDVVIAGESAVLSLPEGRTGVAAAGGGLPRLVYLVGRQKGTYQQERESYKAGD
jgi:enoyl-CoA hydratase/carnithine racemase